MNLIPLVEEQFQSEIKLCYQKRDSLYADLVTVKAVPVGDKTYFNRSHAGTPAGQKARFGKIPRNGGSLDRVPCEMETYYAGDEIDEQEVSSTSANGMLVITDNAIASMNQRVDELILNAVNTSTQTITSAATDGMTIETCQAIWAEPSHSSQGQSRGKQKPWAESGPGAARKAEPGQLTGRTGPA